jgi:hypothetical protein
LAIILAIIFISFFLSFFLSFFFIPFPFVRVSTVVEIGAVMIVRMCWLRHRCIHLDPESAQHRQRTVERLKSFAGLDAGQTSPVEAELELVDQLLLGQPLCGARVAQHSAEIFTGANPVVLCAHIDTSYATDQMCQ